MQGWGGQSGAPAHLGSAYPRRSLALGWMVLIGDGVKVSVPGRTQGAAGQEQSQEGCNPGG